MVVNYMTMPTNLFPYLRSSAPSADKFTSSEPPRLFNFRKGIQSTDGEDKRRFGTVGGIINVCGCHLNSSIPPGLDCFLGCIQWYRSDSPKPPAMIEIVAHQIQWGICTRNHQFSF